MLRRIRFWLSDWRLRFSLIPNSIRNVPWLMPHFIIVLYWFLKCIFGTVVLRQRIYLFPLPLHSFAPLAVFVPGVLRNLPKDADRILIYTDSYTSLLDSWLGTRLFANADPRCSFVTNPATRFLYVRYRPAHGESPLAYSLSRLFHLAGLEGRLLSFGPRDAVFQQPQWSMAVSKTFELTRKETIQCAQVLAKKGFNQTKYKGIIALNVRDSGFRRLQFLDYKRRYESRAHPRDSDICIWQSSVEIIIARGYFVVRTGRRHRPAPFASLNGFWDFGASEEPPGPMDFYLARCVSGLVTTGAGWDFIPIVLGKPFVIADTIEVASVQEFEQMFNPLTAPLLAVVPKRYKVGANERALSSFSLSERRALYRFAERGHFGVEACSASASEIESGVSTLLDYLDSAAPPP